MKKVEYLWRMEFAYKFDRKNGQHVKDHYTIDLVNGKPEIGRICTIDLLFRHRCANAPYHYFIGDPGGNGNIREER